jgi:hypothetical protein
MAAILARVRVFRHVGVELYAFRSLSRVLQASIEKAASFLQRQL